MIFVNLTNMLYLHQNVLPMKIVLAQRTLAILIFATVDQMQNALEVRIHVQLGNVNVASMKNVHPQKLAFMGTVVIDNL